VGGEDEKEEWQGGEAPASGGWLHSRWFVIRYEFQQAYEDKFAEAGFIKPEGAIPVYDLCSF